MLTPKNILIDLNIILDYVLARADSNNIQVVIDEYEAGRRQLFVSAHSVTTFAYLLEKSNQNQERINFWLNWLLYNFNIVDTTKDSLKMALASQIDDYEDAVIERAALVCGADLIITRNLKDFKSSQVKALSPEQFVSVYC